VIYNKNVTNVVTAKGGHPPWPYSAIASSCLLCAKRSQIASPALWAVCVHGVASEPHVITLL